VLVLGLLRGLIGVRRLGRTATPVRDPACLRLVAECAAVAGVRRRVRVLQGAVATTPLTWGVVRPTVLLPADAGAWPLEYRRAALLHELAHVGRADCLVQLLALGACALFWFHPGVWWCARRLWLERERACDDRVLAGGVRPSVYAECMLRIADAARSRGAGGVPTQAVAAVSATIVRPSRLLTRLDAVLDERVVRRAPSRPARRARRRRRVRVPPGRARPALATPGPAARRA
jgi:beta-lactamase regulating signal transducer with metallopeptidase domain